MVDRKYDLVLFGATGYTGKYTAEHIVTHLPTNLAWAVAGRSQAKLSSVVQNLKELNPDRVDPAVEIAQLDDEDLSALARKTKLLVNCVGPYCIYGTPVVEACVLQKTHYLDATGESPWVKEIVEKYHSKAKSSGSIIIPEIGVESAPPDLIAYDLASYLRTTRSLQTKEVILTVYDMKGSASGGTLESVQQLFNKYTLREIAMAGKPHATCPISLPKYSPTPLMQRVLGIRNVSGLDGTLTTSIQGYSDTPVVYRSWGLLTADDIKGESYGPNFKFSPHATVRNALIGVIVHITLTLMPLVMAIPQARWLMKKLVFEPGHGPSREDTMDDRIEYRALGIPDADTPQRAFASLQFSGSMYHLTGILLAQGAATILYDDDIAAKRLGGGVLTPATLGSRYIDRLSSAGVVIETKILTS